MPEGHDLRHCKLPSCPNECDKDVPTRGIWANICTPCRKGETPQGVVYHEQRQMQRTADPEPVPAGATLEQQSKRLVPIAKQLDKRIGAINGAKTHLAQTRREAASSVSQFARAIDALKVTAQQMLGGEDA